MDRGSLGLQQLGGAVASGSAALDAVHMAELARGVVEQPRGSNDGERIRIYQKAAGAPAKSAWCASYAFWAHRQAGVDAYRSAWCPDWARHGRAVYSNGVSRRNPAPGDWILVWSRKERRYVHITSIHGMSGDYYITIGGNESDALRMGRMDMRTVIFVGTYLD